MEHLHKLIQEMILFDKGVPSRIQHFLKVHSFSKLIGESEGLDEHTLFTLEAAAIVHDIGIKPSLEKYGKENGHLQEMEGPAYARKMLTSLSFEPSVIDRVCYLVAHHHTYTNVDGMDYRILLEADFLVNLYEGNQSMDAIQAALNHIFRTQTGIHICKTMFDIDLKE